MPIIIHLASVDGVDDIDMENHGHHHQSNRCHNPANGNAAPYLKPSLSSWSPFLQQCSISDACYVDPYFGAIHRKLKYASATNP